MVFTSPTQSPTPQVNILGAGPRQGRTCHGRQGRQRRGRMEWHLRLYRYTRMSMT